MKKIGLAVLGMILCWAAPVTGTAESEFSRPLFSKENRFPALGELEVGVLSYYHRFDESGGMAWADWKRKEFTVSPYLRYGLFENLTASATLPYGFVDSDRRGKKDTGFRDITLGLELLAYEYTFGYPYVLPYVELILPTGSESKNLGNGETDLVVGAATGTTVYDIYHYILDGRYNVNKGDDGVFSLAAAFIWDLSERFSVLAEAKGTSEDIAGKSGVPIYFRGGMCYRVSDQLTISWYGGGAVNADEDGMGAVKVGYSF